MFIPMWEDGLILFFVVQMVDCSTHQTSFCSVTYARFDIEAIRCPHVAIATAVPARFSRLNSHGSVHNPSGTPPTWSGKPEKDGGGRCGAYFRSA